MVALLPACVPKEEAVTEEEFLRGGVFGPWTGPMSPWGAQIRGAAELAIEEINAFGGVLGRQIKMFWDDDEGKPEAGLTVGERFATKDKVDVIFGGVAFEVACAMMDVCSKYDIPFLIGCSTSAEVCTKIKENPVKYRAVWKLAPSTDAYGDSAVGTWEFLLDNNLVHPKGRNIISVVDQRSFGLSNAAALKSYLEESPLWNEGWRVILEDTATTGETDWLAEVTKIKAAEPDIIFLSLGSVAGNTAFVRQFAEAGIKCPIWTTYTPSNPEYKEVGGEAVEGILWSNNCALLETNPVCKSFMEKLDPKLISGCAALIYDQAYMIAESYGNAGCFDDLDKFIEAMNAPHRGRALGIYVFDPITHTAQFGPEYIPTVVYQIQEGKDVPIWPPSVATGEYVTPSWMK